MSEEDGFLISDAKKAFLAALAKAQGAYEPIVKDKSVAIKPRDSAPYEFQYATLAEILAKTRKALSENGLSVRSKIIPGGEGGGLWLQSILAHCDGYEDVSEISLSAEGDIKQFGGRITYLRRYLIGPQIGVSSEDDQDDDTKPPADDVKLPPPPARGTPQRAVKTAPKPPTAPPADLVASLELVALARAFDEPDPNQPPVQPAANKIQPSQVKWLRMKLESLFNDDGKGFLSEQGLASLALEDITDAQFAGLRAALIAL